MSTRENWLTRDRVRVTLISVVARKQSNRREIRTMSVKIRFSNWLNGDGCNQISLIPRFDIFWNEGVFEVSIGWLSGDIQLWFGSEELLINI
jgi:hypothetical protein